jgi:hypothetical protein
VPRDGPIRERLHRLHRSERPKVQLLDAGGTARGSQRYLLPRRLASLKIAAGKDDMRAFHREKLGRREP